MAPLNSWVTPNRVLALAVAAASIWLLVGARDVWFFGDDWAFIVVRRGMWASGQKFEYFFYPHNEHLSTLPVLLNSAIFNIFGLRSYYPYIVPVVAAHAVLCVLLYKLMLRCGIQRWTCVGAATIFAFFGSGAENLIWAFQVGFVTATALGIAQMILADHRGPVSIRDAGGAVLGCLGVLTVGVAISMVATVGTLLLLRRRWLAAVIHVIPAAAIYFTWYVFYASEHAARFPANASQIPPYVRAGFGATFNAVLQLEPTGLGIGITLLLALASRRLGTDLDTLMPALAGAIGAVGFFTLNGYGRATLGVAQATGSRYVYVAGALVLPLVALGLDALHRAGARPTAVAAGALIAWSMVGNVATYYAQRDGRMAVAAPARARVEAAVPYALSDDVDLGVVPEPVYSAPVTMGVLRDLVQSGALPASANVPEDARLQAAADFGIVEVKRLVDPSTVRLGESSDVAVEATQDGCVELTPNGMAPRIAFDPDTPGVVTIDASGPLVARVDQGDVVARREIPDDGLRPRHMRVNVHDGIPGFELTPNDVTVVCGLTLD